MNSSSENLNSLFKEIYLTTVTFVFTFFTLSAYSPCFTLSCVRLGPEPDPTATPPAVCRADATCFVAHVPRSLSVLKKKKKKATAMCYDSLSMYKTTFHMDR